MHPRREFAMLVVDWGRDRARGLTREVDVYVDTDDEPLEALLGFYRALADETRLRLAGLLVVGERSVGELAAEVGQPEAAVVNHLAKLEELGLVRARREGPARFYAFDGVTLRAMNRQIFTRLRPPVPLNDLPEDEFDRVVLRNFREGDRLTGIPVDRKKRLAVLRWLAAKFEPGRTYREAEVNEIIERHHPDYASLRRFLVDEGLMERERGIYRRLAEAPTPA